MAIKYDKPFKTFSEQIALMQEKNIIVADTIFAESVLNSLSYYTLMNGYKDTLLVREDGGGFIDGISIELLYTLHLLDTSLNAILFKNILYVERFLKTRLSYLISKKYGVYTNLSALSTNEANDYLASPHYHSKNKKRRNILRSLKEEASNDKKGNIIKHYKENRNHVPAWILVTCIPFGLSIEWYGILNPADKSELCNKFITAPSLKDYEKKDFLLKSLLLLKEYRNDIAHGNRTFSTHTRSALPEMQILAIAGSMINIDEYRSIGLGKDDTTAAIAAMFSLIDDTFILNNFYADLFYVIEPYKNMKIADRSILNILNLPEDILNRIKRQLIEMSNK